MKPNVQGTMENIRTYLEEQSGHNYFAEMFGEKKGFLSQVLTHDRVFWVVYGVEEHLEELIIEIHPEINCSPEYRAQTSEYLMHKNAEKKIGNIRLDDRGSIHLHIEHGIKDEAASIKVIETLEEIGLLFLHEAIEKITCLAHGKYYAGKGEDKRTLMNGLPPLPDIEKLLKKFGKKDEEPDDVDTDCASINEGIDALLSALSGGENTHEDTDEGTAEDGIA